MAATLAREAGGRDYGRASGGAGNNCRPEGQFFPRRVSRMVAREERPPRADYFPTLTGAPTEREEMPHPLDTFPHRPPFAGSLHRAGTNAA
jgi:hypothetical protein